MKNKKIYKVVTFVVLLTVLLSVFCVNASAYVFEGRNDSYFIPEQLYYEEPYVATDHVFEVDLVHPWRVEYCTNYITAGQHVSSNCFKGNDMILRNINDASLVPIYDNWLAYIFEDGLVDDPLLYSFSVVAEGNFSSFSSIHLDLVETHTFGENRIDYEPTYIFSFAEFLEKGFYNELDSGNISIFSDVEVLLDRKSNTAFISVIDHYTLGTFYTTVNVHSDTYIGFRLFADNNVGWDYFGFNGYELMGNQGFTVERLIPVKDNSYLEKKTVISLDGSSYDGMTGNVTNVADFTANSEGLPDIVDGYYSLLLESSVSAQGQLWFPSQDSSLSDFSSELHSVGRVSFDISAAVRDYVEFKFVEGISGERWGSEWCLTDSFLKIVPTDFSFDTYVATYDVLDINGNVLTTYNVDAYDPYAEWISVVIYIELDPCTDSIILDYRINGKNCGTCSKPLTIANNSIRSVYCSMRTSIEGSGMLLDNFRFSYANDNTYREEFNNTPLQLEPRHVLIHTFSHEFLFVGWIVC